MAALTDQRQTASKELGAKTSLPVAASETIYAGSMVNINSNGYAVSATDSATDKGKAFGVATETVDNSAGSNGDKSIVLQEGLYLFANDGMTQAKLGEDAYVKDDQTVGATTTNSVAAGKLIQYVSASEVWILIRA